MVSGTLLKFCFALLSVSISGEVGIEFFGLGLYFSILTNYDLVN